LTLYCEVCGRPIKGAGHRVLLEGAEVLVCDDCFAKLTKSGRAVPVPRKPQKVTSTPKVRRQRADMLEVVDDYPDLIRRAREERGWTTAGSKPYAMGVLELSPRQIKYHVKIPLEPALKEAA